MSPKDGSIADAASGRGARLLGTAVGFFFELSQVLFSLAQPALGAAVAVEFHRNGRLVWFGLVVASMITTALGVTASVVHDYFGRKVGRDKLSGTSLQRFAFVVVLPFSPVAPVLNWLLETMYPDPVPDCSIHWLRSNAAPVRAVDEDYYGSFPRLLEVLNSAVNRRRNTHVVFYTQSAFAVPEIAVQLLALSVADKVSPTQLASVATIALSLISKCYVVCFSASLGTIFFKCAASAHDAFGLVFLATALLRTSTGDVSFLGSMLRVDQLSRAWLLAAIGAFSIASALLIVGYILNCCHRSPRNSSVKGFPFPLCFPILVGPAVVLLTALQASWATVLLTAWEPTNVALAAHTFQFVRPEFNARLEYLLRGELGNLDRVLSEVESIHNIQSWFSSLFRSRRETVAAILDTNSFDGYRSCWRVLSAKMKRLWETDRALSMLGLIGSGAYVALQIFTFTFPIIHVAWFPRDQTALSWTCFGGKLAALLAMAGLLPRGTKYFSFLVLRQSTDPLAPSIGRSPTLQVLFSIFPLQILIPDDYECVPPADVVEQWMAEYYLPSVAVVCAEAIPLALLPPDTCLHLSRFVSPEDLNLSTVDQKAYEEYREVAKRLPPDTS